MARAARTIALDVGAAGVKAIARGPYGAIVRRASRPVGGRLDPAVGAVLEECAEGADPRSARVVAITGGSAARWAAALGLRPVNEVVATCRGALVAVPDAGAVLEIGGERARFLRLEPAADGRTRLLRDFRQNSLCSAGTGSFLEQESHRLGLGLEEFGRLAAGARAAAPIAGRCEIGRASCRERV
jgi:activator of 2-hydroxyglutaryl-CoA dehydratase